MTEDRKYDTVSVDDNGFDCSLEIKVWNADHTEIERTVRIHPSEIPSLMDDVVRHSAHALSTAARRLETGDCPTCGNTGLVWARGPGGRDSNTTCPDCRPYAGQPFENTPRIHRGTHTSRPEVPSGG